jgi:DNA-binding CsgD family transcriptional regulator
VNLNTRLAAPGDLADCAKLFENHRAYPMELVRELPAIWLRLMREEAIRICVFEDRDRQPGARIVGCGATVFVTDDCAEHARRAAEPYLAVRLLRQDATGATPILRSAEIGAANSSDGLNVVILHYAESANGYSDTERFALAHKSLESFIWLLRGYNLKQMLQEQSDEISPPFILDGLAHVLTDYGDYYRRTGLPVPPPGARLYLTGITREEAMATPGRAIAPVFAYTPPRFFFSPCERRLLDRALLGETDRQLAKSLGRALPTVKSLWRTIYNRVGMVDPALLGSRHDAVVECQPTRGRERRRRILEYLRQHPEELRPTASSAATFARSRAS